MLPWRASLICPAPSCHVWWYICLGRRNIYGTSSVAADVCRCDKCNISNVECMEGPRAAHSCPLIPLFKRQVALIICNKAGAVVIESKGIGLVFLQQFPLFRTELGHVGQSAPHGIWVIMLTVHTKDWVTIPQSLLAVCLPNLEPCNYLYRTRRTLFCDISPYYRWRKLLKKKPRVHDPITSLSLSLSLSN